MRTALLALTDELRRLKAGGQRTVPVTDEGLAALRSTLRRSPASARPAPAAAGSELTAKPVAPGTAEMPVRRPAAAPAPTLVVPAAVVPAVTLPKLPAAPAVTLPPGDKATRWQALLELVRNDPQCRASVRPGKKVVLGVGDLDATIMFVGEAPGAEEEIQGEPFVGPAGQLLTRMIQGMGLKRSDVYIGNIMNWRPQLPTVDGREQVGNRPPTEEEMRYCLPFLRAQIEVVNPAVLVALGSTAAQGLLGFGAFKALGEVRGRWHDFAGKPLMVTYHPSYILRNQSNRSKRMIWEDLLKTMERAALPISEKQRGFFLEK